MSVSVLVKVGLFLIDYCTLWITVNDIHILNKVFIIFTIKIGKPKVSYLTE